ncbi:hypothetical protein [Rasiella sp. SM2506]|uniref:hypothetical protein n=1 Tax=Rasiella sp. SM2506 TaxID=3423914 RepID=UPI003D78FE32
MKLSKLLLLAILSVLVSFCSKETIEDNTLENGIIANRLIDNDTGATGNIQECVNINIIAGQNYDAGDFTIAVNEVGDLVLRYVTTGDWELNAIHLYAGDCNEIPMTGSGNPKVGHFPIKQELPNGTTEFEYVLETNGTPFCGCIAAHAEVSRPGQSETAWAEGMDFPGNNWAMFVEFCGCAF